jgi:hypothetical protein
LQRDWTCLTGKLNCADMAAKRHKIRKNKKRLSVILMH